MAWPSVELVVDTRDRTYAVVMVHSSSPSGIGWLTGLSPARRYSMHPMCLGGLTAPGKVALFVAREVHSVLGWTLGYMVPITLLPPFKAGAVYGWAMSRGVLTGARSAGGRRVLGQQWILTALRRILGHNHRLLSVLVPLVGREDVELSAKIAEAVVLEDSNVLQQVTESSKEA